VKTWGLEVLNRLRGARQIQAHDAQYPRVREGAERRQLVIGVDFGTAYTKVVIADNRRARAIPFRDASYGGNPYLLPSVVSIDANGVASLGKAADGTSVSDIKLRILDGDTSDQVINAAVSFLALVVRAARHQFMVAHRDEYRHCHLEWQVNVGLPAEHCRNNELTGFYQRLACAAWNAGVMPGPISIAAVKDCYLRDTGSLRNDAIAVIPEFAAQICGYVRSPMRQYGPHLLIDVGGGTLDVAVFNVYRDAEDDDLFPVFACSVTSRGVLPLHRYRLGKLPNEKSDSGQRRYAEKSTYAAGASYFSVSEDELKRVDKSFKDLVYGQILDVLERGRRDKYPRLYHQSIRVFLCGGGAHVELYSALVDALIRDAHPCHLELVHLPRPDRFEAKGLGDGAYDRLSVAFGLSFDPYDIGTVRLPDEIDDGEAPANIESRPCPACDGTGGSRGNDCNRCGGSGWSR